MFGTPPKYSKTNYQTFQGYLPRGEYVCTKYLSLRQGNPFSCKPMSGEMGHESERTLGIHKLFVYKRFGIFSKRQFDDLFCLSWADKP